MSARTKSADLFHTIRVSTFRTLRHVLPIIIAAGLLFPAAAATQYEVIDLGSLTGGFSWAHDVNNQGQVVGRTATPAGGGHHAFLWEAGVMRDLGTLPGGSFSEAYAINDHGQVVGFSTVNQDNCTAFDGCWHAFLWENGTMTDLGALEGHRQSYAYSINNRGQIVGISSSGDYPSGVWHAVVWENGTISDLGEVPGAVNRFARGVNDSGQIVGSWDDASSANPLLWDRGSTVALPALPGATHSEAYKINDRGLIVGFSESGDRPRAVLWAQGTITNLGTLPEGVWSFARDINDRGQIVGESLIPSSGNRAFVWQDGAMVDLGTLPGGRESYATGINDGGQIAGASHNGSAIHAVLWTKR